MRHLTLPAVAACLLLLLPAAAGADRGGYRIASFHTDLEVQRNSDLKVEEHIDVDYSAPRHGIYRMIPVRYTDRMGYQYSLGFRLLGVDDGHGHPYRVKVSNRGRDVDVRIGDPDREVQGRVTYVIRYLIHDAVRAYPDHDELYWNATGNEWGVPIGLAGATVRLPDSLPSDSLAAVGYAGAFGTRSIEVTATSPAPGVLQYEAGRSLAPMEGLTVDAVWPLGHVVHPGTEVRIVRFLADNLPLVFPLLALIWLGLAYRRAGRDPEGPAAVMVRYEPPPGITPSELGTAMDERVDLRDITAAIVDLAVRGYLVIEKKKKELLFGLTSREETVFRKTDKDWDGLTAHELAVLQGIFESGQTEVESSSLKEKFYRHLPAIRKALYARLTSAGYFAGEPDTVRNRFMGYGVLAGAVVAGLGLLWVNARGGVFPNAAGVPVVAAVLTAIVFFLVAPAMPRRTRRGVELVAWGKGFQEFTHRVDAERLEADRAKNVFESLLPYAMALGIAAAWARKFEGIYSAAGPGWYVGPYPGGVFTTSSLEHSLSSSMADTGRQLAASPRSSGSGGGGFSGGGGGGGGGGSW